MSRIKCTTVYKYCVLFVHVNTHNSRTTIFSFLRRKMSRYPAQRYPLPPQQGYPPQGYPPQGYPPQNYPPPQQGYPPQGYPPQGYPPQGYPPKGYPPQNYPPQTPPVQTPVQHQVVRPQEGMSSHAMSYSYSSSTGGAVCTSYVQLYYNSAQTCCLCDVQLTA